MEEVFYIGLSFFKNIGVINFHKILNEFRDLKTFFSLDYEDIEYLGFIDRGDWERKNNYLEQAEVILNQSKKDDIKILLYKDDLYPEILKSIYDPPPFLFYKGDINLLNNEKLIAVVGTRKPTFYGEKVTSFLVKQMVENNIVIVSGLALGIDSIAHKKAIENKGKTIAVLGSGVGVVYPSSNKKLYEDILKNKGLIISEFLPYQKPIPANFPRRNRIISGISKGVVLVESKEKGGGMITVNYALEQGREVFVVPGSIFSEYSKGPNILISMGAIPIVDGVNDILREFNWDKNELFKQEDKKIDLTDE